VSAIDPDEYPNPEPKHPPRATAPPSPEALIQRLADDARFCRTISPLYIQQARPIDGERLKAFALDMQDAADALASSQEALRQEREKGERVFQAVVYAFEGKPVPPDLASHGMVNRGRKHWEASQEALRAAERAHADEIADMMRELESTAELACQQGRDALKEQHRAEAAERARDEQQVRDESKKMAWPDPTEEMLASPQFNAIWRCIRYWDISVPYAYDGYSGATGNHVRAILEALPHAWECFHCGETFTTPGGARDHFGETPENTTGCLIDRVALEEGGKPERGRGLLMALRKAEDSRDWYKDRATELQTEVLSQSAALQANEQEIARVKADAYAEGVSQERARIRAAIERIELKELLRDVDVSDASS
jgi:hypothetical protein